VARSLAIVVRADLHRGLIDLAAPAGVPVPVRQKSLTSNDSGDPAQAFDIPHVPNEWILDGLNSTFPPKNFRTHSEGFTARGFQRSRKSQVA
jgi:hypothetical protein